MRNSKILICNIFVSACAVGIVVAIVISFMGSNFSARDKKDIEFVKGTITRILNKDLSVINVLDTNFYAGDYLDRFIPDGSYVYIGKFVTPDRTRVSDGEKVTDMETNLKRDFTENTNEKNVEELRNDFLKQFMESSVKTISNEYKYSGFSIENLVKWRISKRIDDNEVVVSANGNRKEEIQFTVLVSRDTKERKLKMINIISDEIDAKRYVLKNKGIGDVFQVLGFSYFGMLGYKKEHNEMLLNAENVEKGKFRVKLSFLTGGEGASWLVDLNNKTITPEDSNAQSLM